MSKVDKLIEELGTINMQQFAQLKPSKYDKKDLLAVIDKCNLNLSKFMKYDMEKIDMFILAKEHARGLLEKLNG